MSAPRTYTTQTGHVFNIDVVPATEVFMIQLSGRPKAPAIPTEVTELFDGTKEVVSRPNDPDYIAAKAAYDQEMLQHDQKKNMDLMSYCFNFGVLDDPPGAWIAARKRWESDPVNLKMMWVMSKLGGAEESNELLNAIMGQTVPTEQEVVEKMVQFPADSQSQPVQSGGGNPEGVIGSPPVQNAQTT